MARNLNELDDEILSDLPGNSPIWVTRRGRDVYLNDAKILGPPDKARSLTGMDQYMYKIDRVLEPTLPSAVTSATLFNPDARRFLEKYSQYSIVGDLRLS